MCIFIFLCVMPLLFSGSDLRSALNRLNHLRCTSWLRSKNDSVSHIDWGRPPLKDHLVVLVLKVSSLSAAAQSMMHSSTGSEARPSSHFREFWFGAQWGQPPRYQCPSAMIKKKKNMRKFHFGTIAHDHPNIAACPFPCARLTCLTLGCHLHMGWQHHLQTARAVGCWQTWLH